MVAEQLLNFCGEGNGLPRTICAFDFQGIKDARQLAGGEFNIEHRSNYLADDSFGAGCGGCCSGHGLKR